jgi:hypothetical protein
MESFVGGFVIMVEVMHIFSLLALPLHVASSIALHYAFINVYTSMVCYTFNYTFVDSCSSFATMFSSLASFYIVYASTKCYSSASFSSNFSTHIKSIDVAPNHVYFLTHRGRLLLRKNSSIDVLIVSMSLIIVCANYIFSLYAFLSAHSKDDDECDGDLTTND